MNGQVRITICEKDFNKIVELANNVSDLGDTDFSQKCNKFVEKLLTYSFIKEDKVECNLYPSEARLLIYLLNEKTIPVEITKNWIEQLITNRNEYKKNKRGK